MENEIQVSKAPSELIAMALDKQADPNVLSKLMDLQERWQAQNARKAYVLAMTAFKQEAPAVLTKNDRVDFETSRGRTTYNYANLGSIVQEMTALLGKHELSAAWETSQNDKGMIKVSCNITHSAGHRETVTLEGPPDISGNKNAIQAIGSSVTYLQRYTLLAALGLATTEDDDGRGGIDKPPITELQKKNGSEKTENPVIDISVKEVTKQIKNKDGKVMKSPRFKIISNDGVEFITFSETFAKTASEAKGTPIILKMEYKVGQYGNDVVNLSIVEPEEPPPEAEEQ